MSDDLTRWLLILAWSPVIWAGCAIAWQAIHRAPAPRDRPGR